MVEMEFVKEAAIEALRASLRDIANVPSAGIANRSGVLRS